ncbi:MAG: hypothetical protein U0271_29680 [Polyangiaceae bacterium]
MSDLDDQKHLLLLVPNFDGTGTSGGSPLSYVKLGSAKAQEDLDTDAKRGDDLCEKAGLSTSLYGSFFADDLRGATCSASSDRTSPAVKASHYDEAHASADCHDATLSPLTTNRYRSDEEGAFELAGSGAELTAELVGDGADVSARGGWRDHTDGNRIVTVRGDRVDVVVGNFKRVVFGRVSGDYVGATMVEAAGGHLLERTSGDVLSTYAIEHVEETGIDGKSRWKVVERAENGDVVRRFSGVLSEYFDGPTLTTTIGADTSDAAKNPEISREIRFDREARELDATSVERHVEADDLEHATFGKGATSLRETWAPSYERRRGSMAHRSFTFREELRAKHATDSEFFVGRASVATGAASFEERGGHIGVRVGYRCDAHLGVSLRWQYGSRTRMFIGNWTRVCIGASAQVDVGINTELSLFTLHKAPVKFEQRLGNLSMAFTKNQALIGDQSALALLMEL